MWWLVSRSVQPVRNLALMPVFLIWTSQPLDTGRRDDAAGGRQPERVGRIVEVSPRGPALGASRLPARIDLDAAHPRQVATTPSSTVPKPATLCPPPRTRGPARCHGRS